MHIVFTELWFNWPNWVVPLTPTMGLVEPIILFFLKCYKNYYAVFLLHFVILLDSKEINVISPNMETE